MTVDAKGDEVFSRVIPQPAAKCSVVNLQVFEGPTHLASPAISLQDLFVKKLILFQIEFESGCSLAQLAHAGFDPVRHRGDENSASFVKSSRSQANVSSGTIL